MKATNLKTVATLVGALALSLMVTQPLYAGDKYDHGGRNGHAKVERHHHGHRYGRYHRRARPRHGYWRGTRYDYAYPSLYLVFDLGYTPVYRYDYRDDGWAD